jgi:hypothetical protein
MLAVVIIKCKQPSDPDHGMPFRQPKLIGEVTIFVRHDKGIKLIDVLERANG